MINPNSSTYIPQPGQLGTWKGPIIVVDQQRSRDGSSKIQSNGSKSLNSTK